MAISTSCFFIIVAVIVILLLLTTRKEKFISRIPLRHLTETEREHYTSTNSTTGEIIVNGSPGILLDQGYQAINITTSDIVFYGGSSSNTERMRLQGTTGNVGIGTNNPGNPLTVIGAASISGSTTTGSLTSAGAVSGASLSVSGTSLMTGNLGIGTATASNPLTVYGNSYVSGTSQLMGNVGIGMAPATYPLNVSGDINCSGSFRVNGTALSGSGSSTLWTTSGSNMYTLGNIGIQTTSIGYTLDINGNFHAQTGVYVGSSGSPGYITMMPTINASNCGYTEFRNGVNRCGYIGYGTNIGGEMCLDLHAENGWGMDLCTNGHNIFFYTDGGTTPKIQIGTVGCIINGGNGSIPALTINGSDRQSGLAINANRAGILVNSTGAGGQSWNIWSVLNGESPTAGSLAFYNQTNNNFGMVLTQAGNLGLGTNTPGSRLSISGTGGNMSSLTNTTTNAMYQQWNSPGGNAFIGMDGSAGTGLFGSGTAYSFDIGTSSATPICFFTNNTGPRMTIDTNGNTTSYGWMINQKSCYGVYYPGYAYFYNNSNVYYGNYAPTGVYSYCLYSGYAQSGYTNNISSVYPWITVQMSGIYTLTWIAGGSIPTGVELFISVAQGNGNELNTGTAGYWGGGIVATFMSYGNAEATLSWTGYISVNTNIRFGCYNGSGSNWYPTNNPSRNAMCIATNVIAGF
jgi:hypothetical protein